MSLFIAVTPVGLPSGELADFSHWLSTDSMADAQTAVEAWSTTLAADDDWKELFTTTTTFGESKISEIDIDTGVVITSAMGGTAYAGAATAEPLPPQIAVVVTINTDVLSRSTRGRYYLPAPTVDTVTSAGRLAEVAQAQMVESLEAAHGAEYTMATTMVVYSRKLHSLQLVTGISVGDVFDTMRTRRDKLVEIRQGAPLG